MQIIINISKEVYKNIQRRSTAIQIDGDVLENAVLNGTPLPKGHGDLIDKSAYRKEFLNSRDFEPMKILDLQEIIIEADKEEVK